MEVKTTNRDETVLVGAILGKYLKSGDIVCLDGDLGAGKTAFAAGIAQGMRISGIISSPTFTILIEHTKHTKRTKHDIIGQTKPDLALYHFDAYRIDSEQDFYDLGFDEYFSYNGVCVIEWADKISAAIPDYAIRVILRQGSDDITDERKLEFVFGNEDDERADKFFKELKKQRHRCFI